MSRIILRPLRSGNALAVNSQHSSLRIRVRPKYCFLWIRVETTTSFIALFEMDARHNSNSQCGSQPTDSIFLLDSFYPALLLHQIYLQPARYYSCHRGTCISNTIAVELIQCMIERQDNVRRMEIATNNLYSTNNNEYSRLWLTPLVW